MAQCSPKRAPDSILVRCHFLVKDRTKSRFWRVSRNCLRIAICRQQTQKAEDRRGSASANARRTIAGLLGGGRVQEQDAAHDFFVNSVFVRSDRPGSRTAGPSQLYSSSGQRHALWTVGCVVADHYGRRAGRPAIRSKCHRDGAASSRRQARSTNWAIVGLAKASRIVSTERDAVDYQCWY